MSYAFTATCFSDCKSEPKFCVEFLHFEEPRRELDQVPSDAKIPVFSGKNAPSNLIATMVSIAASSF